MTAVVAVQVFAISTCQLDTLFSVLIFGGFRLKQKLLGRTEMRTRDSKELQSRYEQFETSRDDRARIATCSLQTATDRQPDLRR